MALLSITINLDDAILVQRCAQSLLGQIADASWKFRDGIDDGLDTSGNFEKFMPRFMQYADRVGGAQTLAELNAIAHEMNSEIEALVLAEQLLDQLKGD